MLFCIKRLLLCQVLLTGLLVNAFAQTGKISGKITDRETGEALVGASVKIEGTSKGASADIQGRYTITGLEPGAYTLIASFISYQTKHVKNVKVKAGKATTQHIRLKEKTEELKEVVIEAEPETETEAAMLNQQKKSEKIQDGISSERMSQSGDDNAGEAMEKVTGVSVEGGKYMYVRGLGDRYSETYLNMGKVPSLDPDRNSVQMDLFPSNTIESITVYKTYTPDLPGSFGGGAANIETRDFPEEFMLKYSSSFSYNTNATFNDNYITYQGSNTDWLGFDNGTRSLPGEIKDGLQDPVAALGPPNSDQKLNQVEKESESFNKTMTPDETKSPFLNHSHTLSVGDQTELFGKKVGVLASVSYDKSNDFYENGRVGRYELTGEEAENLNELYNLEDTKGTEKITWGAFVNTSVKLNDYHEISFNYMHNQSGTDETRYQQGFWFQQSTTYESNWIHYVERGLDAYQLKGEHYFADLGKLEINWLSSFTNSYQDEPDLRLFTNDYKDDEYTIRPAAYQVPARFFRRMNQVNWDNKLDLELPFDQWNGKEAKAKAGMAYLYKSRGFRTERYDYFQGSNAESFQGNADQYIADDNMGKVDDGLGVVIRDGTELSNSYDGDQSVLGFYGMVEMPLAKGLDLTTGARYEYTDIAVESLNPDLESGELLGGDILPSFSLKYELIKNMNLRASYSRTLARPTFRELAPYSSFNFAADNVLTGNENLKRTLINNYDLRWEYYPSSGEMLAVSPFYKRFKNPIVMTLISKAQNREQQYDNVGNARVLGLEMEVRKNLSFIDTAFFKGVQVGANVTLVDSRVSIEPQELERIRATQPDANSYRQLFGQSPYMVNAYLQYNNKEKGLMVNLSGNTFGPRIVAISQGGLPDVFEQPRTMLNMKVEKSIGEHYNVSFSAGNILNATYKMTHSFKGEEYIYQKYRLGRDFSVGFSYEI